MTDLTPEAVKAALEAATPGRRLQYHPDYCDEARAANWEDWDTSHETSVILSDGSRYKGYSHHKHASDAYLDNMAPDLARECLRLWKVEEAAKDLYEAARLVDVYLNILQTPGTEPLNSVNGSRTKSERSRWTAAVRNEARVEWVRIGNALAAFRAAVEGE